MTNAPDATAKTHWIYESQLCPLCHARDECECEPETTDIDTGCYYNPKYQELP